MPVAAGNLTKPAKVRRCRTHGKHRPGCRPCSDWSSYHMRLRRWERQEGISRSNVPAELVAEHLRMLTSVGNLKQSDIARLSGIPKLTIWHICAGRRKYVFRLTADSLLAIQPRTEARPPKLGLVRSVEGQRILRGLLAQGWSFVHMGELMGNATRTAVQKLAHHPSGWMYPDTVDRIRVMADKLRNYDIADLDLPMDGMDVRCANHAAKLGWAPLRDWDLLDITDPDAEPFRAEAPLLAGCVPVPAGALVDQALRSRVRSAAEAGFMDPLLSMTRLEAYAVVAYAQTAGVSAADTGALLGYPQATPTDRKNGQRHVSRIRTHLADARLWFQTEPDGDAPSWLVYLRTGAKHDFHKYLPALLAVQPEPFGYGMTLAQLAGRCGADATAEQVHGFLMVAAELAARPWVPQSKKKATRGTVRRRTTCTTVARVGEQAAA